MCVSRVATRQEATRKAGPLSADQITLFSWGYWGTGTSTSQLIEAADAVEAARGFGPPFFVDIRYRRSGKAPEFVGNAFKNKLGERRYKWMHCLGNRGIVTGRLDIVDEAAADKLLDIAVDCAIANRRLLFFCACVFPRWNRFPQEDGRFECHRNYVGELVLEAAQRRKTPIKVVEWPGQWDEWDERRLGARITSLPVSANVLAAVRRGRKTIPLPKSVPLGRAAALPWGSVVSLQSGSQSLKVITGPAKYKKAWGLYVLECADSDTPHTDLDEMAEKWREDLGVENRTVPTDVPDERASCKDFSKIKTA